MKYIMCSRHFPDKHPRKGQPTHFVEKILLGLLDAEEITIGRCIELARQVFDKDHPMCSYNAIRAYDCQPFKGHTIRVGSRFKPSDMVSLRVWQLPGGMYTKGNKQIEFAQVEVKKVWPVEINNRFGAASFEVVINGKIYAQLHYGNDRDLNKDGLVTLAKNDGLELDDFVDWFNIHPKKNGDVFKGQVICWNPGIDYNTPKTGSDELHEKP